MVTHVKFLDLTPQHLAIHSELDAAIDDVLTHSVFIGGKWVQRFEQAWAEYVGAQHCIGVANGTDALEIALRALNVQDSNVIVPALTAAPTAEAVINAGARLSFCDCNHKYLMDIYNTLSNYFFADVIVPVHLYGNACDMDGFVDSYSSPIRIIEDCAQAHGTRYKGQHVGTFGLAGAFSFYPSKNLGAFGDAGAIVTNNDDIAHFCRVYANGGRESKDVHALVGRNSRLDALQAAILYVKLQHLDEWVARRREIAQMYDEYLHGTEDVGIPFVSPEVTHSYHIYAITVHANRRDDLRAYLLDKGVETRIHYPIAVPDQKAYRSYPVRGNFFRALTHELISLPMGPHVTESDVKYVAWCIREFYND